MRIKLTKAYAHKLGLDVPAKRQNGGAKARSPAEPILDTIVAPKGRYTLEIPGFVPTTLNRLTRRTFWERIKLAEGDKQVVAYYAREQKIPLARYRRRVSAVISKPGPVADCDAYFKSLLDCLTACNLLISDSPSWCELGKWENVSGPRKTVVTLEDL